MKVQEMGGLSSLDRLIRELPDLLSRNKEILDEVNKDTYLPLRTMSM